MALIKCEKCGELISDKAKRCPNCEKNRGSFLENILVYAIWFTIIIVLVVCVLMAKILSDFAN